MAVADDILVGSNLAMASSLWIYCSGHYSLVMEVLTGTRLMVLMEACE